MALNADGTVTIKTKGKLASTPSGSGTGKGVPSVAPRTAGGTPAGMAKQKGRGAVGKSARAR